MATTTLRPTGPIIRVVDRPVSFTLGGSPIARVEPITLTEVKAHLKLGSSTSEDSLLELWIQAARVYFEETTGRQIINATWEYALDAVPAWSVIELPRPPLFAVESVLYDDGDGTEQTLSSGSYTVNKSGIFDGSPSSGVLDPYCGCGSIELVSGTTWPTTSGLSRSLRIRRTCGYGETADEVPGLIKAALLFLVAHFWRNRHEVTEKSLQSVPLGADILMRGFKYTALQTLAPRTL